MESWRKTWRDGIAPQLSTTGLQALRMGLASDDVRLLQGATISPPPMMCVREFPVDAACAVGFCGWQGEGLATVGEVEDYFARACHECDRALNCPAACRWFLKWFDDTPRDAMRRELLKEVDLVLASRTATLAVA